MVLGEFDLIAKYFTRPARRSPLGVGDDCALLAPAAGMQLAVSCDMLVEGRHFLSSVDPARLGHKALAVNLSDLAACGARPLAFTLALSMPRVDEAFLEGFARGLFALADAHEMDLVGGDTTAGPLNLCVTVFGEVPAGQALLRSGARAGDDLWVSHAKHGGLGDARLALEMFRGRVPVGGGFERLRRAMECPRPRVALGVALRGIASSAIDVSDGLIGDLGHILERSAIGATVDVDRLPVSAELAAMPPALRRECAVSGGDDYELLFTAAAAQREAVLDASRRADTPVARIGHIDEQAGLRLVDAHGAPVGGHFAAFDHFVTP